MKLLETSVSSQAIYNWAIALPMLCVRTEYVLAWCSIFHSLLIWYATCLLSEKKCFDVDPTQGVEGVWKDIICACMLLHLWFQLIWYATWPCSEKVEFWPFDPTPASAGRELWVQNSCYHVAACVIPFNLICNMTIFWKVKFSPPSHQGRGGVCGQNICYNVAAFVIPFNFICNMTIFWKSSNFDPLTPPTGSGGGWCLRA